MLLFVGAYDLIQQPKNISETAKKNVCFFMFVDEETAGFLRNTSDLDDTKRVGLWRIVVVRNLPYDDPRRNGKVELSSGSSMLYYIILCILASRFKEIF